MWKFDIDETIEIIQRETHLGPDDERNQRYGNHGVHPHQPAQEGEMWCDAGAEMRLNLLDTQLPRDQHGEKTNGFAFPMQPTLWRRRCMWNEIKPVINNWKLFLKIKKVK